MLNTYRYATAEELHRRALRALTLEDEAIMSHVPYRFRQSDQLDADKAQRLHEGAERRRFSLAFFVSCKEWCHRELYA